MIAEKGDWRDGMELFATICNERQPGRRTWQGGTPFGWQSWGVMATKNNIQVDMAVADFFAETLRKGGFAGEDGLQIMSIDAWDNLNDANRRLLTGHCASQGQITGIYRSPFSLWWGSEDDLERKLFEGCEFTANQCVLKANGKPIKYDGAFCLDPTHPATLERFAREAASLKAAGFEYFKIDFTSNGMIQADSYYDPSVRTAVEAYNYGFTRFIQELDRGGRVFTALSIAPIFPYHYGNARRIACDTWGKIDQSEYAMNAVSYGWWTNEFYQFNDPDHLVLVGKDAAKGDVESLGENRARYTTGICSGMVLLPDVWSLSDSSGRGDARLSIERAQQVAMNADVNAVGRIGRSFRPLYGGRQWRAETGAAENLVTLHTDSAIYLAAINYSNDPLNVAVPIADLAPLPAPHVEGRELWTGEPVTFRLNFNPAQPQILISVPPKDARLYRFTL
jgi:alpha-galactosidase